MKPEEKTDTGLLILAQLFTSGSYEFIIEKILSFLDGIDLTALQTAHPVLDQFIQVKTFDSFLFHHFIFLTISQHSGIMESERKHSTITGTSGYRGGKMTILKKFLQIPPKDSHRTKHNDHLPCSVRAGDILWAEVWSGRGL